MKTALERILSRTRLDGNCLLWTGCVNHKGYGRVLVGGKNCYAHRVVWSAYYGEIPKGKMICHKCDNPLCVNIKHLYLGDQNTNSADMVRRGRAKNGSATVRHEKHPNARLTYPEVEKIRLLYARGGVTQQELSDEFKISRGQIWRIVSGRSWYGERPNA